MKAHLAFAAVCCLAVAGCGPSEPTPAPVSTAATPATSVPAKAAADTTSDIAGPDYSAVVVPVFLPYQQPVYAYKNLPVFGALVHFEQNVAAVEPFLKPVHPRLHIDWKNLADHTRLIDWSIVAAINENLRTALDQHPTGGGMPAFGLEFQHDLINLRQVTRELNAAAETQDLGTARNRFAALEILLGPRPAVLTGNATPPAQATQSAQPAQSAGSAGSADAGAGAAAPATPAKSGDAAAATTLADITPRTDLRTHYPFWPAPSGFETVYLEADPPPKVVDWSDNMTHNTNYDTPKYPQPGIVNDRDLSEENHYTYRVSPTEVH